MRICLLILALGLAGCCQRGFPPTGQIVNVDRVDERVWRGGQPPQEGFAWLKAQGVCSVVNLRDDPWKGEQEVCGSLGLSYTNFPLSGFHAPARAQVDGIMAAIQSMPPPVFLHCQFGCDRTGLVVACWRIKTGWNRADAFREAELFGLSPFEFGMRRFIKKF